jgi:hypothetical protein
LTQGHADPLEDRMHRRLMLIMVLAAALCGQAAAQGAPQQPLVLFPGTNWSIAPPRGFTLSAGPPTLLRHPNGAYIMLLEVPRERLDAGSLGKVGDIGNPGSANEAHIEAIEQLTLGGRPAALTRMRMTKRAMTVHNMLQEGEGGNVHVILSVPDGVADPDAPMIRAALTSIAETKHSSEQRLGDVPFRFTDLAGMRVVTVVANSVVILTRGPGDQMDEATDQPFAMVSRVPMGPRDRFDPQRDVSQAAAVIRERYPGATILTQKVEPTAQGPVAAVVFQRIPPGKSKAVAGVSWTWADKGAFMMMIGQFPPEKPETVTPLVKLRDGVKAR